MNTISRSIAAAVFLVLLPTASFAQSSPGLELPSEPLVVQPPDYSKVAITYSYPDERAAKANGKTLPPDGRPRMITMTRTKDIIWQEIVDGLGAKIECWHVRGSDYSKGVDAVSWGQAQKPSATAGQILQLDWIDRGNYVGTIKYANRDCLVFAQGVPPNFDLQRAVAEDKLDSFRFLAFIDKETRLPVEDHHFGDFRFFRFEDAPTAPLTLPPDLAQQMKVGQEMMDRLSHRSQD